MNTHSRSAETSPSLSVVIPFYNEEHSVRPLLNEVRAMADSWPGSVEVISVDDGSSDHTAAELEAMAHDWPACRAYSLQSNSGQAAALWYGFHQARAPIIGTLDGDGQNVPADFLTLRPLLHDADMVVGVRVNRNDTRLRLAMSRVANSVRRKWLRDNVRDSGCAIKLFRREVLNSFLPIRSLYSFMPACAARMGYCVREHPVRHRPRSTGVSNYGLGVMWWRPAVDMLAVGWMLRRRIPHVSATAIGGTKQGDPCHVVAQLVTEIF